ncbi:MAG: nitronate monooxygenase [Chloroflexota bacterium]
MRTRATEMLGIQHPIVLGGMSTVASADLVANVSAAGGLGILGLSRLTVDAVGPTLATIRERTDRPFGVNFLAFMMKEEILAEALRHQPRVVSFAWPRADQDLAGYFERTRRAGSLAMFTASTVVDARRAAEAGADIIAAQGTEGGGHVGLMSTMVLTPMIVDAVGPIPVLASGGIVDGRGLAAALMLGAAGILLGTRFMATPEAPIHPNFKQLILDSDGHDTVLTEVPDVVNAEIWPGAYARAKRNRWVERWIGNEGELRRRQVEVQREMVAARAAGDADSAPLLFGQDAGLIAELEPAADIVASVAAEAEALLAGRRAG